MERLGALCLVELRLQYRSAEARLPVTVFERSVTSVG